MEFGDSEEKRARKLRRGAERRKRYSTGKAKGSKSAKYGPSEGGFRGGGRGTLRG